jgi:hypothetical protein
MTLAGTQTVTGAKTFGAAGNVGKLVIAGSTSGTTILNANATAGTGTVVLPTTGTLATLDGTETLTNKTLNSTASITGSSALTVAAGGTNQNVTVTPSGTGNTVLNGNVGIGTTAPSTKLHVAGSFRLENGTQAAGRVLTSDANGVSTWTAAAALPSGTSGQTLRHDGTTWVTNSNIFNNGTNVSIGNTSPNAKLDVYSATQNAKAVSANDGTSWISLVAEVNNDGFTQVSRNGDVALIFSIDNNSEVVASNGLVIAPWSPVGATNGIKIMEDGKVGISTSSPGYLLTVNGQPGANGYTAFTNFSDSRLKTNISSLETGALSKILQLKPVSFQYNDKYLQLYPNSDLNKVHKGFIAQEIQKVFPEMVSEMKESPDGVQYLDLDVSNLQVYLVKALQEQQVIIETQKKEIETLKVQASNASQISAETTQKITDLENKMNAMLLMFNSKQEVTAKQK